ncbi:MAG: hypothetical protein VCB42_10990, partial [Myxococcota bacterium]
MSRFRALRASLACFAPLFLLPGDGAAFTENDLLGTWFVLIHYRNSETNNPDADRWEDKIWTFEKRGSRLQWTEYPIVVFGDQTGRFERYRGVRSRVLAAWEPNARQQSQIDSGLEINSRGSKSKSLRGTLAKGYKSTGRLRTQSASIIGYMENWSITGGLEKPVFARDDLMGSGRTENMEGRTEYATQEILDGGRLLQGLYDRDGIRKGTFQMTRAADVTRVAGKSKKVQEERRQLFMEGMQRQAEAGAFDDQTDRDGKSTSAEERAATRYIVSLPPEQRDELLAKLQGASPADQARVMREHYATLPPEEQQRLFPQSADSAPSPQAPTGSRLSRGMTLQEGLAVLHAQPEEVTTPFFVRRLQV